MKSLQRCPWVTSGITLYEKYHDEEWGVPVYNDRKLFEFLLLESAQAGLSWLTILKKRNGYKKAFANFDPKKVAKFTKADVARLMKNTDIVRNRLKIESAISNAKLFLEIQKEFKSFANYQWGFTKGTVVSHKLKTLREYPVTIPKSVAMAKDMKKRGFKFLGPTVLYAHMQATGQVNDHALGCFRRREVAL